MRRRAIFTIMATLFLVGALFTAIPLKAAPDTIKVGIFGPMRMIQGQGMLEGCQIAKEWVDSNPISIGGTDYTYELVAVDSALGETEPEPTPESGIAAMTSLIAQNPDFIVGGFRSEGVFGGRAVAIPAKKIWFITGAATNHIIDCEGNFDPDGPLGGAYTAKTCREHGISGQAGCVYDDYANFKYIFRNTPPNVTNLLYNLAAFCQYDLMPKLANLYAETEAGPCQGKVRVAVIAESAMWCDVLWDYFTHPYLYPIFLGPQAYVDLGASARVAPDATDVSAELTDMDNAGVRMILEILSGEVGRTVQEDWHDLGLKSVLFGINVVSQETETWDLTGGGCQYEGFLGTTGFRSALQSASQPYTTVQFWDLYVAHAAASVSGWSIFGDGHKPIYTSWGAYNTLITMKGTLETAGISPPFNTQAKSDALIPYIERGETLGVTGLFKYTGFHLVNLTDKALPWSPYITDVTKAAGVEYWIVAPFVENGNYTQASAVADAKAAYAANHDTGGVNPDMKGTLHDLFTDELWPFWLGNRVRTMIVCWQAGRHEIVWPKYSTLPPKPETLPFYKLYSLNDAPSAMYPYPEDVDEDADVDIFDMLVIRGAFGETPGDPDWQIVADVDKTAQSLNVINILDALDARDRFGQAVALPLEYGDEPGHWYTP